jgi:hypothetical protein
VTVKRSGSEGRWADIPSARARFALEAVFLIVVAGGAALARLSPQAIIGLMLVAWLLVALIERASSREQARAPVDEAEEAPAFVPEPAEETEQRLARRDAYRWLRWRRREAAEPLAAPTASLEERPSRAHVRRLEPEPPPLVEAEVELNEVIVAETPAPGPAVTKRPLDLPGLEEPAPEPAPQPEPPPSPARVEPPPPPPPEPAPVAARVDRRPPPPPREWNLWELERRAREQAGENAPDEEWTALFIHLRQFANAEGVLPKEFDDLVRESFAELIQAA